MMFKKTKLKILRLWYMYITYHRPQVYHIIPQHFIEEDDVALNSLKDNTNVNVRIFQRAYIKNSLIYKLKILFTHTVIFVEKYIRTVCVKNF